MRPFQQLRFWARRAPVGERAGAGLAMLLALALVGWLLVPDSGSSRQDVSASGPFPSETTIDVGSAPDTTDLPTDDTAGGEAAGTSTDGSGTAAPGATGTSSQPNPGTESQPDPGTPQQPSQDRDDQECVSPPGSLPGITDDEVQIAVVLTQVVGPAANALFNIPSPDEAKADYEAAIAGINGEGGVACRRLVARYYIANPADESQMMRLCRDIADAGVFAVADTGSLATRPAVLACFGQLKIPYFGAFFISETLRQQFYPYLYSLYTLEHVYNSTAFGLRELGFYDPANGFEKLGFIHRTCEQEAVSSFRGWIREAGVEDSKVETYSVGCPSAFASESDLAEAVRQFQSKGVTHVVMAAMQGDYQRFTEHAELQGFRPQYGFPDEALLSIAEGNRRPNPRNMANALAITLARDAEQQTPGMSPTPGTQRCNEYRSAAGLPPVYEVPANAGNACSQLWMVRAAVSNAPELSHQALPAGLQRTGSIDFSFPQGIADFSAGGVTTGGQFWRVAQFQPNCERRCWRVIQPEFRRGRL